LDLNNKQGCDSDSDQYADDICAHLSSIGSEASTEMALSAHRAANLG
jgi:hypothetical protein